MENIYNLFVFLVAIGFLWFAIQFFAGLFWCLILGILAAIGAVWMSFTSKK